MGGTAWVTISVASVNGFSGTITPGFSTMQGSSSQPCVYAISDLSPITVSNGQTASTTVEFQIENGYVCAGTSNTTTFGGSASFGGSPQIQATHSTPQITFTPGYGSDFTVTVGTPSSPTLADNGSVSYPITVASMNEYSGW